MRRDLFRQPSVHRQRERDHERDQHGADPSPVHLLPPLPKKRIISAEELLDDRRVDRVHDAPPVPSACTSPASLRTDRWCDTVGAVISNRAAISPAARSFSPQHAQDLPPGGVGQRANRVVHGPRSLDENLFDDNLNIGRVKRRCSTRRGDGRSSPSWSAPAGLFSTRTTFPSRQRSSVSACRPARRRERRGTRPRPRARRGGRPRGGRGGGRRACRRRRPLR